MKTIELDEKKNYCLEDNQKKKTRYLLSKLISLFHLSATEHFIKKNNHFS